jgi:hypothetical protein
LLQHVFGQPRQIDKNAVVIATVWAPNALQNLKQFLHFGDIELFNSRNNFAASFCMV